MNDIYKPPESEVAPGATTEEEIIYDIAAIKRYRWLMVASLALWYFGGMLTKLIVPGNENWESAVLGIAVLANIAFFAGLASKIYQKIWITLLCVVVSLVPYANLFGLIFMNVKAKEIIRYYKG